MKNKLIAIAALLTLAGLGAHYARQAQIEKKNRVEVADSRNAISLIIPTGWKWDTESGKEQNIEALSYPSDSAKDTKALLYVNVVEDKGSLSLQDFFRSDTEHFRKEHPDLIVKDEGKIRLHNGKEALIGTFISEKDSVYEKVAFIEEKYGFITLVLSASEKELYEKHQQNFSGFVSSYRFEQKKEKQATQRTETEKGNKP